MNIVAVLAIRNEKTFLANALQHLIDNGHSLCHSGQRIRRRRKPTFCVSLASSKTLFISKHYPTPAISISLLNWKRKQRLYDELDADWLMHLDADGDRPFLTALESASTKPLPALPQTGADAINFDEFVFLPVDHAYIPDHDGPQPMRHYYYFDPGVPQKINAWRAALRPNKVKSGGHKIHGTKNMFLPKKHWQCAITCLRTKTMPIENIPSAALPKPS